MPCENCPLVFDEADSESFRASVEAARDKWSCWGKEAIGQLAVSIGGDTVGEIALEKCTNPYMQDILQANVLSKLAKINLEQ